MSSRDDDIDVFDAIDTCARAHSISTTPTSHAQHTLPTTHTGADCDVALNPPPPFDAAGSDCLGDTATV
jgi:hypothetical protein